MLDVFISPADEEAPRFHRYPRIHTAIKYPLTCLAPTQAINLALLVNAMLAKRTLCLSALARTYPCPAVRWAPHPQVRPTPSAQAALALSQQCAWIRWRSRSRSSPRRWPGLARLTGWGWRLTGRCLIPNCRRESASALSSDAHCRPTPRAGLATLATPVAVGRLRPP